MKISINNSFIAIINVYEWLAHGLLMSVFVTTIFSMGMYPFAVILGIIDWFRNDGQEGYWMATLHVLVTIVSTIVTKLITEPLKKLLIRQNLNNNPRRYSI